MTPQQLKTKWTEKTSLVLAGLTFLLGFGINSLKDYISNESKVDLLTREVARLTIDVENDSRERKERDEKRDDKIASNGNRLTALETIVFNREKKMKVFKFNQPYKPNGRTAFPETQKRSGVYLIKENGKLVYIGFSGSDLYKTLYRHFQEWTDVNYNTGKARSPIERVTYKSRMKRNNYTVRIVFCSVAQAERLEKMLIIKHQPRDNSLKYDAYKVSKTDITIADKYQDAPVEQTCPF